MNKNTLLLSKLGQLITLALLLICFSFTIKSQNPSTVWTFVYSETWPHEVWGCPLCTNPLTVPAETRIAYAADYYYFAGSQIIYHLDRNFFATFQGGRLVGGNYETQSCRYKTWGYSTFARDPYGSQCTQLSNKVKVQFSEPAIGKTITIKGAYPQRIKVTENGRQPIYFDLLSENDGNGQPTINGYGTFSLSNKKISGLTVESNSPTYVFSVDSISVTRVPGSYSPKGKNPPPNYCNVTPIDRPAPQIINSHDWSMNAEVTDDDGLVLTDVRLKGRLMAERISVPYYQITTKQGETLDPTQRGELRPSDTGGNLRSRLVSYEETILSDRFVIKATYAIDAISSSQSCLSITQSYEFLADGVGGACTPPASEHIPVGFQLSCNRWRALVNYDFKGSGGKTIQSFNVAQRSHFQVNGHAKNSVGLFKDCDVFRLGLGCIFTSGSGGPVFKSKINPLVSETYAPVIVNGKETKSWDNFHQSYKGWISEPGSNLLVYPFVAAGCPECAHSHWRWGTQFGEAFGNGYPFVPQNSKQDLSIGIFRYRPSEEDPSNIYDLFSLANPEPVRSRPSNLTDLLEIDPFTWTTAREVVQWMSATAKDAPSDEFFRHYSFFITDDPYVLKSISGNNLFSRNNSPREKGPNAAASNGLTGGDAPVSIVYRHLYKDGSTTFVERDPGAIAQLPTGYVHYNNISYDVRTDAAVSGPHTINFNLPSVTEQPMFDTLRVLHSEPDPFNPPQARWVDRTILAPNTPSPDFANRNISAKVNEVGPFVIARLINPPPPNTNISDLGVTITESADPVVAGNALVYTVNVTNTGPDMATGVVLSSGLSPDVRFISADGGTRTCNEVNGTVVCNMDSIASETTLTVTITVEPDEGQIRFPSEGKPILNTVFVTGNESDPVEANNESTISTNALPNPNAPPTAEIQSPARDAIFSGPAAFSAIIGATDSDGTITQAELFLNGESIGNGTLLEAGKYRIDLIDIPYGEHSLIAIATDNGGRKAVSDTVRFFVNGPILITLDSPEESSLFGTPVNIPLTATGVNGSGTIAQVQFFSNGEHVGNGTLSGTDQYNFTWVNAQVGPHSLRAVATDGNGVKSWSESANIYITYAPTVNITSPASGASYPKNGSIALTADARDFDGYVSSVEFLVNGTGSLGQATLTQANTFTRVWSTSQPGTYSVTAKAIDDAGLITISNPITVTVTNNPPTVSIMSPANGSTFGPLPSITLSADASDSDGYFNSVDFYDGSILLGSAYSSPYEFLWSNAGSGSHVLTAKVTDDNAAVTTSNPVSITVDSLGNALLVVGNTTLSAVDTAIKVRLQNLGLNVVVKSATSAVTADATGKLVVVISDSVSPTQVNTKFRTVAIPVVTLDPQLFDDMGMTATTSGNFGTTSSQKNVTITDAAHPMAGGLSGTVQVTNSNTTFGWGKPNANVPKIATLTSDSTKATNFGYVSGAVMPGLTAPERRVGFFYTASSSSLTTNGGLLFDNAVRWAAGL